MKRSSGLVAGVFSFSCRACVAVFPVIAVAGCGGGHTQSLVPAVTQSDAAVRQTESVPSIPATLYVAGQGSVYVYPLTARNVDAPTSVLAGEYNAAEKTAIAGITTDRKGTLSILNNYGGVEGPSAPSCHVLSYPFRAPTGANATVAYQCRPGVFAGLGIISAPNGEIDVYDVNNPEGSSRQVERFLPGGGVYSPVVLGLSPNIPANFVFGGIAAGAAGNFFLALYDPMSGGSLGKFAGGSNTLVSLKGFPPVKTAGYLALAAGRGVLYAAVYSIANPANEAIVSVSAQSLQPGGNAITFPPGLQISAMACDASGNLYVGFTIPGIGTGVQIYDSSFNDLGILVNPVRRGNPAGAVVTGIAIAQ